MSKDRTGAVAGAGAIYGLGIFGAWVYLFQHAHTFWAFILAFFRASSGQPRWSTTSSRCSTPDQPRCRPGELRGPSHVDPNPPARLHNAWVGWSGRTRRDRVVPSESEWPPIPRADSGGLSQT